MGTRYCTRCSGRLAADHDGGRCSPCLRAVRNPGRAPDKPVTFWQGADLRAAAAERHFGHLVLAYRRAHEPVLKQAQLALWLDLTQAQVSRLERAIKPPSDLTKLDRWAGLLGVPDHLLWFTPAGRARAAGGDTVRRRDVLKIAAVAGVDLLGDSPWQRLTDTLDGHRAADGTTVRMLEERTTDLFLAEETTPARDLLGTALAHRRTLRALVETTPNADLRRRLLSAAGETEALAGWFLFDLNRPRAAERAWRDAITTAEEAGDGPLVACVLGNWSYLHSAQGDHPRAVRALEEATGRVRGSAAGTQAWLAGRQAEEHSALGDAPNALHALDRAMTVFDYANPKAERVWTSFFTTNRLGSLAVSTYGKLGHRETDTAAASLLGSLSPTENKVRALVLADLAATAAGRGDVDQVAELVAESAPLAVRTEASLAVDRLWGVVEELRGEAGQPARVREWLTDALSA